MLNNLEIVDEFKKNHDGPFKFVVKYINVYKFKMSQSLKLFMEWK